MDAEKKDGGEDGGNGLQHFDMNHAFQNLTPDDLGKLLDLDDGVLDLDLNIPDGLFGPDGHVLLDGAELGLSHHNQHQHDGADNRINDNGQQQSQQLQQENLGRSGSAVADAARSVLASLESTLAPEHSAGVGMGGAGVMNANAMGHMHQCHSAPVGQQMQCFSTSTVHHGGQQAGNAASYQVHQGGFAPSGMHQQQGTVYLQDPQTGNIIHVTNGGHGWQMPGHHTTMPQMFVPAAAAGMHYSQPVQYFVHHQQAPSMSYSAVPMMETTASAQNSPGKRSPGKRRRQRQSTETVQQRSARAESGYTYDPATGRMLRHGPALMATARDNKEVPVIKSLFETFHEQGGFTAPPASPFRGIQLGETNDQGQQQQQAQPGASGQMHPAHSAPPQYHIHATTGGVMSNNDNQNVHAIPSGKHINANTGHGFITSLVTRELKSSTPSQTNLLGPAETQLEEDEKMRGVSRDKWSLFWDAYLEKPSNKDATSSIVDGVKQEAIFLGKFPSRDQAGRAHDIAALKLLGEDADTNFPKETYQATLPILHAHTDDEVVAALMKDSELARQRTSKFKGVRKTSRGQYEARADVEVISPALKDAPKEKACRPDLAVEQQHHTATFNA